MLEIVNLLTVGMSSFNFKFQVPTDISQSNQYIDPKNLQTQENLHTISQWTKNQKMKINEEKSKIMIFNFTNNYQFSTRLSIQGEPLETVKETKLLGTILTDDLKWQKNTALIVKRANARMQLLQTVSNFITS